ncbi:MAG: SdpI family protein [Anaerolineales bacterium]|nr:SdpI family protein [Anaerolineales bacterium]
MQTLLFIYIVGGLLLVLIALPLIAGKIKPNLYYGFRVPTTLKNPEIWYATNKHFAERLLISAVIEIAVAIGLYFWPNISVDVYALSILGVFVITSAVAFIQSWRYMKTLS